MYQVGLMETDKHVQYFWEVLASFSQVTANITSYKLTLVVITMHVQEELRKFIKFACNQERIPHTCPCREGGSDITHVPPYPMKIAPPDGSGENVLVVCSYSEFDIKCLTQTHTRTYVHTQRYVMFVFDLQVLQTIVTSEQRLVCLW